MKILRLVLVMMIAGIATGMQCNAQEEKEEIFFIVETMPEYPGGNKALIHDITSIVKYPKEACSNGITGTVYVNFVVDKKGEISNVTIARGVDPLLNKEVLRVINKLDKKWKPGIQGKNPTDFNFTIPFNFKQDGTIEVKPDDFS